ncbi:MAG: xylose isomerase, partial [Proteobacteria bacterium]|nr:xylose isomerase [Pseudomonadota bacterium]
MAEYFPDVQQPIRFEGAHSQNPLSFKYYDADALIDGESMAQHLRFSIAYWHCFKGVGRDIFGDGTFSRSWNNVNDPLIEAEQTLDAAFEFFGKLGVNFYCFHDRDLAPEGETFAESCRNLELMVEKAGAKQRETGIKLLWGTANLFNHPRYAHGAATNPDPRVFAHAAAQVKHAIAATQELGGENFVFWGGREGYETLMNTDMKREQEHLARFFHLAVDYARSIGFTGQFLIEPKPMEPTKHQYDFDAATVLGFLSGHDLLDHFKLNIEANHATLSGHTFEHDLTIASQAGKLGSVDANQGDLSLGWDTDQFPTDLNDAVRAMIIILNQGGLGSGGLNFDAKLRRGSTDPVDLFHAHIGGMDTYARGLIIARKIIDDGVLSEFVNKRYSGYEKGIGRKIGSGDTSFDELEAYVLENGEPEPVSGRQELLE